MDKKTVLTRSLLALALVALGAGGGYQLAKRLPPDVAAAAAGDADRKVLYWYDPMVPTQKFEKPGKSPFMDMQLVPRYADEAQEGGVSVSSQAQQSLGLRLAQEFPDAAVASVGAPDRCELGGGLQWFSVLGVTEANRPARVAATLPRFAATVQAWQRRLGVAPRDTTLIGFSLALSSTAVVIEVLSRQGRLSTITGRTSFSILLLQDLAVVPLLFLVNILGPESQGSLVAGLAQAFGQALLVIGIIAVVGKLLLRPLFRSVAAAGSSVSQSASGVLETVTKSAVANTPTTPSSAKSAAVSGWSPAASGSVTLTISPTGRSRVNLRAFGLGVELAVTWAMA